MATSPKGPSFPIYRTLGTLPNNPTADYGEYVAAARLGLQLVGNAFPGYDALSADGIRFQIKSRRLTTPKTSRQLGALRNLHEDLFDYLVIVLFGAAFEVREIWKLPIELVRAHAELNEYQNAHILYAQGAVLRDPYAVRIE